MPSSAVTRSLLLAAVAASAVAIWARVPLA